MASSSSSESASKRAKMESELDAATQRTLELIDCRQSELDALNEKASEEILRVEQKFNRERKPLYEKRAELIQSVPHFWLTAFINHPQVSAIIGEEEEAVLQHLSSVEVEEFEDIKSGYAIKFVFNDNNGYLENRVLVKEFHLGTNGEPFSKHTKISWRDGKDLSAKHRLRVAAADEMNSKTKKGSGKKRRHHDDEDITHKSFFAWYESNSDPSVDDIAEAIKDDIWPNPLQYFLVPDIEVENGNEDDDDDNEDDDEEDEEEPEDSVVVLEEEEDEEEENEGEEEISKESEEKSNDNHDANKDAQ